MTPYAVKIAAEKVSLQPGIIYGLVQSRRLGSSLGINLLPAEYKLCCCNCLYCQYGWTKNVTFTPGERLQDLPSADAVASALETGLAEFHATTKRSMPSRSAATAAPTLYPALAEVIVKIKSSVTVPARCAHRHSVELFDRRRYRHSRRARTALILSL